MNYFRPQKLSDALDWLGQNSATIAAGCTDLFPATAAPALEGPLLDITAIEALRGITLTDTHWRFGAATTWSDILAADLPPAFAGLKLAAREVGSVQIQNSATLAGNLCNASPAADGVPCLMTLEASVEISSLQGIRVLPLSAFILGPRQIDLQADEIVTAILIPKSAAQGASHFLKLGGRKYLVISIVMVAGCIEIHDNHIKNLALSVGACSPVAVRLSAVEQALKGLSVEADIAALISNEMITQHLSPIEDIRGDVAYRQTTAVELVRRCLAEMLSAPEGAIS